VGQARSTHCGVARWIKRDVGACEDCGHDGSRFRLEVHHIDGNWSNTTAPNLRKLCSRCHGAADAANRPEQTCDVGGCSEPVNARGQCLKHYMRWYRETRQNYPRSTSREPGELTPDIEVEARPPTPSVCTIAVCDLPHYGKGFCRAHYLRWYRRQRGHVKTGVPLALPVLRPGYPHGLVE